MGKVRKETGANIRTFRRKGGLSQEKLGEKPDLHPVHISQVEPGAKAGKRPTRGTWGQSATQPTIRRAGA